MADEDEVNWEQQLHHLNRTPGWSMVAIRDSVDSIKDDFSVFPPVNHENLHVYSFHDDGDNRDGESPSPSPSPSSSLSSPSSRSASSSSFSLSPSDSEGPLPWTASDFDRKSSWPPSEGDGKSQRTPSGINGKPTSVAPSDAEGKCPLSSPHSHGKSPWTSSERSITVAGRVLDWWKLLLMFLRSKTQKIMSWFSGRKNVDTEGSFWSFYPSLGIAFSMIWWWMRVRARRRRCREDTVDQLRKGIKEKDEKIVQLLHQIALMNELLIKRHKALS